MLAVQLRWHICIFLNAALILVLLVAVALASSDTAVREASHSHGDTLTNFTQK